MADGLTIMQRASQNLGDIENMDKEIIKDLNSDTQKLQDISKKVQDAEQYYDRSNTVIRNMMTRVFTNKLVLYSIIILLGLLIIFLLYIKIKYKILGEKK